LVQGLARGVARLELLGLGPQLAVGHGRVGRLQRGDLERALVELLDLAVVGRTEELFGEGEHEGSGLVIERGAFEIGGRRRGGRVKAETVTLCRCGLRKPLDLKARET
jgi:hypothetical protein